MGDARMPESALTDFVHRFEPAGPGGPHPTLLLLHGTGGNEDDLIPLGRLLSPHASLLAPRGKVLERGMPRFFRRLAEGVFDVEDLRARTHELADFVEVASAAYGIDRERLIAVGFSNGANIAASILLLRPATLRAAILIRAMVPLVPDPLPSLEGAVAFIGAGRADPIVTTAESERLARLLRESGAVVTIHWSDAGHTISPRDVEAARDWMTRV